MSPPVASVVVVLPTDGPSLPAALATVRQSIAAAPQGVQWVVEASGLPPVALGPQVTVVQGPPCSSVRRTERALAACSAPWLVLLEPGHVLHRGGLTRVLQLTRSTAVVSVLSAVNRPVPVALPAAFVLRAAYRPVVVALQRSAALDGHPWLPGLWASLQGAHIGVAPQGLVDTQAHVEAASAEDKERRLADTVRFHRAAIELLDGCPPGTVPPALASIAASRLLTELTRWTICRNELFNSDLRARWQHPT